MKLSLGKKISELTKEDLIKLIDDKEIMNFIGTNLLEICSEISKEATDNFVLEQFKSSEISFKISSAERELGKYFSENEGKNSVLIEYCKKFLENETDIFRLLPAYLIILSTNLDIKLNKEDVKNALRELVKITASFPIESNYEVVSELQDFIYSLGQYYFDAFKEDPISDMKELSEMTENMIEYIKPFLDKYQREFEEKLSEQGLDNIEEEDINEEN